MPKSDPTLTYLQQRREDAFRYDLLPNDTPANRMPIRRLSWNMNSFQETCSDEQFAEAVQGSALSDAQFYVDTCFVTGREVDPKLWAALLGKSIVITQMTWRELGPWLDSPFVNHDFRDLLLEVVRVGHPGVRFEVSSNPDPHLEHATRYYIELLTLRKRGPYDLSRRDFVRSSAGPQLMKS